MIFNRADHRADHPLKYESIMSKILKKLLCVLSIGASFVCSQGLLADCGQKACCDGSAKSSEQCATEGCKDKDCKCEKCGMKDCQCAKDQASEMHAE